MRTISLYVEKESFIHGLDPVTKLWLTASLLIIPFIVGNIESTLVCLGINLALLSVARVIRRIFSILAMSLVLIITLFIIQGMFYGGNRTAAFALGSLVFYREGLRYATLLTLRFFNIISASMVLILTTRPSDLIESLVRRGLSPRIGYVLASVLQIIPMMISNTSTIMDAQRSRGMETEGRLVTRMKAYLPLMAPLVMSSLVATQERAMALEVRAFGARNPKTFLHEEIISRHALPIRVLTSLGLVAAVIWRVIL